MTTTILTIAPKLSVMMGASRLSVLLANVARLWSMLSRSKLHKPRQAFRVRGVVCAFQMMLEDREHAKHFSGQVFFELASR